jgi:hypothetical protein
MYHNGTDLVCFNYGQFRPRKFVVALNYALGRSNTITHYIGTGKSVIDLTSDSF